MDNTFNDKKQPSEKKRILLVEDDQFISRAYKDGLGREGFIVDIALDGVEALKQLRAQKPDLILLDLIMPKKDGFEVLEEIIMDDQLKNIPVIILSNLGQESDVQKGTELGAVDYLVKSNVTMKGVIERVRFVLAKHEAKK